MSQRIRYQAPFGQTIEASSREHGHLVLLHSDVIGTEAHHTFILAWPVAHQRLAIDPVVGRPLKVWPEFRVAGAWGNATPMCVRRLLRYPQAIIRLCPMCSRAG